MSLAPTVAIRKLRFARGERLIFDEVSLEIAPGKITAIMGPSGTGKTTLLHLMAGLLQPQQGSIQVLGEEMSALRRKERFKLRQKMSMLFQSGALFTDVTVYENVAFPLREHTKLNETLIRDIVKMKLEAVGLRGTEALMPAELSGGMARRVALARAISLDPMLMLYDEPFAGQDPITMGVLVQLIRRLNDALKLTSVIVSHDVDEVFSMADFVYLIAGAKIIAAGSPASLRASSSDLVKQFINGLADGPVAFRYPAKKSLTQDFLESNNAK